MEVTRSNVRLTLLPDRYSIDWFHIQNRIGVEITLQDLPNYLRTRMHPLAVALQDRRIEDLTYDARSTHAAKVSGHKFDLRLLPNYELISEILFLVDWWINYTQRRTRCSIGCDGKQPHKTWRCECGEDVVHTAELCNNDDCPSWITWRMCTNGNLPVTAITAKSGSKRR